MKWSKLLSEKRYNRTTNKNKSTYDLRSEFQKDYHRIIGSASFRRLQDKTQVFPLDKSDFIRTRLTHSLEVASFGKSLGQTIFLRVINEGLDEEITLEVKEHICNILECAGLIHDIGNPPFGHFGEDSIRDWFKNKLNTYYLGNEKVTDLLTAEMLGDFYNFEGNAQALRLLSRLHFLVDENGMHLTYALLNTIIKYPISSLEINKADDNIKNKKMGYFYSEKQLFKEITSETGAIDCRYPLTYILEAADDIAYMTADIEDAVKKGLLTFNTLKNSLKGYLDKAENQEQKNLLTQAIEKLNVYYNRSRENIFCIGGSFFEINAVQNWIIYIQRILLGCATDGFVNNYKEIMEGRFKKEIIAVTPAKILAKALKETAFKYAFCSEGILKIELSAASIYNTLLDSLVGAIINYDTEYEMSSLNKKLVAIISDSYRTVYKINSKDKPENIKLYYRLLLVTDFICGMTDSYAKELYRQIKGIN